MLNILSVFRVQAIFRVKIAPGTVDRRAIRGPAVPSNRLLRMCPFFRLRGPDRRRSQYRAAVVLAQFQCDRSNWPGSRFGCWFTTETRSEEHTSELQSLMRISYAVICLKKTNTNELYIY